MREKELSNDGFINLDSQSLSVMKNRRLTYNGIPCDFVIKCFRENKVNRWVSTRLGGDLICKVKFVYLQIHFKRNN